MVCLKERTYRGITSKAGAVKTAYRSMHGKKRVLLNYKMYKLSVRRGEIESIDIIRSEVSKSCEELEEYKKKYNDLEKERNEFFDMMKEKDMLEQEISDMTQVNKELADYVETLEKRDS